MPTAEVSEIEKANVHICYTRTLPVTSPLHAFIAGRSVCAGCLCSLASWQTLWIRVVFPPPGGPVQK